MKKNNQSGFTILELMIATSIFAVVLLGGATLIVQIGRMYYKGISSSRTQETTRKIVDNVSRSLQFTKDGLLTGTEAYCIGTIRYSYKIGQAVYPGSPTYALKKDNNFGGNCIPSNTGEELLGENMRLERFDIIPSGNSVNIKVQVIYASGGNNPNNPGDDLITGSVGNRTCIGSAVGSQWCASSLLDTTIFRRIAGS